MKTKAPASSRYQFPVAAQVGTLVAAVFAIWGAFNYYDFETAFQNAGQNRDPYMIRAAAERFAGLRQAIPANAVLGYVTDADPGTLATVIFDTAQYSLAPRLLEDGVHRDLVLGNFTRPGDFQAFGARFGLRLERDFGNGVILYRTERR